MRPCLTTVTGSPLPPSTFFSGFFSVWYMAVASAIGVLAVALGWYIAVYARHGYAFKSSDLRAYFAQQAWYRVDAGYRPSALTAADTANVQRIKAREQALVWAGGEGVRDFELRSRARAHRALGR